jgi:hypothetical protein
MKLLRKSMIIALWVELASLFLAGLFSSGSLAVVRAIWALHAVGDILAGPLFRNAGRSAGPWYILFLAIIQWAIYVIAFLAAGSIAQMWRRSPPNRVGGRIDLPPPTPPDMRVRVRRFLAVPKD